MKLLAPVFFFLICFTHGEDASIDLDSCHGHLQVGFPEPRRAVVIGISDYSDPALSLPKSKADAVSMRDALCGLGFSVTMVIDAYETEIETALKRFESFDSIDSVAVVYYSGHGAQIDGNNYLIPKDFRKGDLAGSSLDLRELLTRMGPAGSPARNALKIVILDACRDDDLGTSPGLALPKDSANDTWISFSSPPGETTKAGDPSLGNSPFTATLLAHISEAGITINEIFAKTRREYFAKTRNVSWDNVGNFRTFWFRPPSSLDLCGYRCLTRAGFGACLPVPCPCRPPSW